MLTLLLQDIGFSNTDHSSDYKPLNVYVAANASTWSPKVPVALDTSGEWKRRQLLIAIATELKDGVVFLGMHGTLNLTVGKLRLAATYYQKENIPTCFAALSAKCDNYSKHHDSPFDQLWPLGLP